MKTQGLTILSPQNPSTRTSGASPANTPSFADALRNAAVLKYGSRGDDVRNLQSILNKNGYHLQADGIFGPKTRAALLDYQKRNGLAPDGIAGAQTWKALEVNRKNSDYKQSFVDTMLPILKDNLADGIDPKVVLAQAILETGWGRFIPGNNSNNLFGLTGRGPAGSVPVRDSSGQVQNFRSYSSLSECVADYVRIITNNPRYSKVLSAETPEKKAHELQKAGYASDPAYADKLCSVINTLNQMGLA